jgi:aminoglycoside 3-N-acetyltransferase I
LQETRVDTHSFPFIAGERVVQGDAKNAGNDGRKRQSTDFADFHRLTRPPYDVICDNLWIHSSGIYFRSDGRTHGSYGTKDVTMAYTVFRASLDDVDFARTAVADVHVRGPVDDFALNSFLNSAECFLLLAVEDGCVLGSLNGYSLQQPDRPRPQFLLYELDVREEHRRRGIGTALVNAFTDEARAAGAFEVWVVSNESRSAALELYRKCGYRRENDDEVIMSVQL